MPRTRAPLAAPAIFEYAVLGRPVSAQPRSGGRRKDPHLERWREAIRKAIDLEMDARGFELHVVPMRAQIVWFTPNPEDSTGPDLDNIAKPFLDGLEGKVIAEDRIFHEVHLRKVDINHQFVPEPLLVLSARASDVTEFVYVRVERLEWRQPTRLD